MLDKKNILIDKAMVLITMFRLARIKMLSGIMVVGGVYYLCMMATSLPKIKTKYHFDEHVWQIEMHAEAMNAAEIGNNIQNDQVDFTDNRLTDNRIEKIVSNNLVKESLSPQNIEVGSWRNISDTHYLNHGAWLKKPVFVSGNVSMFYLYGASIANKSEFTQWDTVRIYGQWHKNFTSHLFNTMCCLQYDDGMMVRKRQIFHEFHFLAVINAFLFSCPLDIRKGKELPIGVSLSFKGQACTSKQLPFVKPYKVFKEKGEFGVSSKIAYGTLTAQSIIEWCEAMKVLGVDKVITYAHHSLNKRAIQALQYYERQGFMEVFPYTPPAEDYIPRDPSQKYHQLYADARVLIYDAYERLRGYSYVSLVDFDEFLMPSRNRTLKQLVADLLEKDGRNHVKTAGFYFKTKYFIKTWGKVNKSSDLEMGQYLNTTKWAPFFDKQKGIVLPNRIHMYTMTHEVQPRHGYKMENCSSEDAYIRHYRGCREEWPLCKKSFTRVKTTEMIDWADRFISDTVRKVRHDIFGDKQFEPWKKNFKKSIVKKKKSIVKKKKT